MTKRNEEGDEGGQNGPSAVSLDSGEAMVDIARHLVARAMNLLGDLDPDASVQVALREKPERTKLLDDLVLSLSPEGVHLPHWTQWLDGGPSPFPKRKQVDKVGKESEWPSQTMLRTSPRVGRQQKKVEGLRAQLAQEEERLAYAKAHDKAALQWFVTDHLLGIIGPVFAMGPAWTVMRAISSHMSDKKADEETDMLIGKDKEQAIVAMRAIRVDETSSMLEVLDLGSGNEDFEADLRAALMKVCKDWGQKREKLTADGRKARSAEQAKTEVHPKSRLDAAAILEGLKRAS